MKNLKTMTGWLVTLAAMAIMLSILPSCDTQKTGEQSVNEGTTEQANFDQLYEGMTRKIKVNIGTVGERRYITGTRGMPFGGMAALVGTGRNQRAHIWTATLGEGPLVEGSIEKIDMKALAAELGVVACIPNAGRNWTMDEMDIHVGEVLDFQGVKMAWVGDMTSDEVMQHFSGPYIIGKIQRNTKWIYKAGSRICLLREPSGIVWVMQEYTREVDPTLTMENIHEIGPKLKNLPEGWVFETKIIDKELTLDNRRTGLWSSILRDELGNTYEATGFDDLANYIP